MKIDLDKSLVRILRDKFNEYPVFSYHIKSDFHVPTQNRGTKESKNASNCLCASLDRMSDIVDYLNDLDIQSDMSNGTFQLCDFLNQSQTLIDCIEIFGKIYHVPYPAQGDISSFHEQGITGKGNDEAYFKYIRSLCSVHPIATNAHPEYQGDEPEWCPYLCSINNNTYWLLSNDRHADFVATVYRNDVEGSHHIYISLKQIFHYVGKRYQHIKEIVNAIEAYNQEQINYFQKKKVAGPDSFNLYTDYITSLIDEFYQRRGADEYLPRVWAAVFHTHFDDSNWETALDEYKLEMKKGIERVHIALQNMSCLDDTFDANPVQVYPLKELDSYSYEKQKIEYLFPSADMECVDENYSETFISEQYAFNQERMQAILNLFDDNIKNGLCHEELRNLGRFLDSNYHISNSEWARIQLKIMEPILGRFLPFNYFANDWHLYWQVQIAKWKLGKRQNN